MILIFQGHVTSPVKNAHKMCKNVKTGL